MKTKRFYYAQSPVYGFTVYDRNSQTPAFEFGADINMKEFDCMKLCLKLNKEQREVETEQ